MVVATRPRVQRGSKGRTAPAKPAGMALTGTTVTPSVLAADGAPTLVSALATSAFNIGNAGGSWLGGLALSTSLGLRGPALAGLVLALAALAPLALLAARSGVKSRSGVEPGADAAGQEFEVGGNVGGAARAMPPDALDHGEFT